MTSLTGPWVVAACIALCLQAAVVKADDAATPPGWEKVSDTNGIVVYQKHQDGLETISVRGEALIMASVTDVADVMKNNATAADWMPLVVARRDLEAVSATERVEYTHIGMPWPLTDRYFVNRAKAEYLDDGVLRLTVRSVDDPKLIEADKVLGVLHHSEFVLTPRDGGRTTHMTLEVNTDPRGTIPMWLTNISQRQWPRKFFNGLRDQLGRVGKLSAQATAH